MDDTIPERWLPVVGYEDLYEVSDLGKVRSLRGRHGIGCMLKPQVKRYLQVNLYRDGKMRSFTVHGLVACAFLGPRQEGLEVCHGPAGRWENAVANLAYGTPVKNRGPDKHRDGTIQIGTRHGLARLNDEIVRECRRRAIAGEPTGALAREFGVSASTMRCAVNGSTWRHVPLAG